MKNEQARTIEVLQLAVQMEIEGKEFYQKASQKSSNKLAKELFQQLANEKTFTVRSLRKYMKP